MLALLRAHDAGGGALESAVVSVDATGAYGRGGARPMVEGPGMHIGPYKLLQKIGEGGFGVVYMAEQDKPVRRVVALKIIKAGMDTAQVIARFGPPRTRAGGALAWGDCVAGPCADADITPHRMEVRLQDDTRKQRWLRDYESRRSGGRALAF